MSHNKLLYGSEHPSVGKRLFNNILIGALLPCLYGVWNDFVVSLWWLKWGSIVALVFGSALAPQFCRMCWEALGRGLSSRLEKVLTYTFAYLMLLIISWIVCVRTVPALTTRWTAADAVVEVQLQKRREYSRRSCDYQITGVFLRFQPLGYACISASDFEQLPKQGTMRIHGPRSIFGMHIDRVSAP